MKAKHPKFDFFQEVTIRSLYPETAHIDGCLGVVVGRTETEDGSSWYYAIYIYPDSVGWCAYEDELLATGKHVDPKNVYDGSSIRVAVDRDGSGDIVESDGEEPMGRRD